MWDGGPLEDERLKLLNELSQVYDMLHKKEQDSAIAAGKIYFHFKSDSNMRLRNWKSSPHKK
jgi:hypothetical protein